jgi:hypothetical protein
MIKLIFIIISLPNFLYSDPTNIIKIQHDIISLKSKVSYLKRKVFNSAYTEENLHEIARTEAKLMTYEITYDTYMFLDSMDIDRDVNEVLEIVDSGFKNAFIFTDLGDTHLERWKRINGWAYTETNFKNGITCKWTKGQYLKSLKLKIKYDSIDRGVWQINDVNDFCLTDKMFFLYDSGILNFRLKKDKGKIDLFNILTNCTFRCLVETERRGMGLDWKQDKAKKFLTYLSKHVSALSQGGYYDDAVVNKYYYTIRPKTYFLSRIVQQ